MPGICRKLIDRIHWESREWRHPSRPAFIHDELDQALLDEIHWRAGEKILDVGCAHGTYMQALNRRGLRPIGIDLDVQALTKAASLHQSVAAADGLALPFADGTFHAVLCHKTLYQLRDPPRAAAELARVLHPAGRLVFSTSNPVSPYARVQTLALQGDHNRNWNRGNHWSAIQWCRAFAEWGLIVRAVYSCNLVWPIVFRVCDRWLVPNEWMRRYSHWVRRITRTPLRTDHPYGAAMDYVVEMTKLPSPA
ncbi:MAG TPA: class I SAM-dependent methyltransferase [Phycisphaerae bacterium]|nr:class I SAM-dependent methyltransferase [Phycisphaerae bacterium]